jgi:hypothetical protein
MMMMMMIIINGRHESAQLLHDNNPEQKKLKFSHFYFLAIFKSNLTDIFKKFTLKLFNPPKN